jgi:integrase
MLKVAARQRGRPVDLRDLFLDADLLAAAACDAGRLDGRGDAALTLATLGNRRISARSFMRLMEDYLGVDSDDLVARFEAALRIRCELSGQTYYLKAGRPTGRKADAPAVAGIEALLREAGASTHAYRAERDVAFASLLASTGLRLGSAIEVDGRDFYRLGSNLCLAIPREKCKRESVQVYVRPEVEEALVRYIFAFNRYMAERGSTQRIGFGLAGPFWRCPPARPWTAGAAALMVRRASGWSASRPYGPHAIRRFVAQNLISQKSSRSNVADVLRQESVTTLDEHYAPAPGESIRAPAPNAAPEAERRLEGGRTRT